MKGIAFFVALALFLGGLNIYLGSFYNERTISCTVTGKDRGYDAESKSSKYRIYTQQCGTFENKDAFFRGKFNSADVQGAVQEGKTYKFHVVGARIGFFSTFPNVLDVKSDNSGAN